MEYFTGRRIRDSIIPRANYEMVRATLLQKGSPEVVSELSGHLTYIRLARAAIFNLLLLSIALFSFGTRFRRAAPGALLFSVMSYSIWRVIFVFHYTGMRAAYAALPAAEQVPPGEG